MPEIPFAHQWTIFENDLLPLKDSVDGCLDSTSVSNIPEFEYYMDISPNGYIERYRGQTWIFLHLKLKDVKKVEANFNFTIESANYSYTFHYIYKETIGWGNKICKTNELFDPEKRFIVDGKFTVKVNGIFKFETEDDAILVDIDAGQQKWIGGELGDQLWSKEDTKNFIIITGDKKEIKVHKFILENRSDVFTAMLNSNMKETKENKVEIPDYQFTIVETAFKLIYNCSFTTNLSLDELMQLLQFFDQYQLLSLKAKVEPFLIAQISQTTVVRLTNASIFTNSFKLKQKCMEFLLVAFVSKTPLDDFDDLDKDVLLEVVKSTFYQILQTEE